MASRLDFSKGRIESLPLPETGQRSTYLDEKVPGLQLRITSNGIKTFSVFRRPKGGKPERVTVGRFPIVTVEQARRKAAQINLAIESGANPAQVKRANRQEMDFAELFQEFLDRHAKPRKRTWREDKAKYDRYLAKTLGPKKVSAIARTDIASVHSSITRAGHATTANRVLALVSSVYGWARSAGLNETNPSLGIRKNPERSRDRFLQASEIPRFFVALSAEPNQTIRDYFLLSLLTGARRSNVLAMKWAEIDFDRAEWRIPRTKNDDPQTVPLTTEAVGVLTGRAEKKTSAYVFPGFGDKGHLVEPKMGWKRIFDRDEMRQLIAMIEAAGGSFKRDEAECVARAVERARGVAKKLKLDVSAVRMADLRIHDLRRTLGSWQARTGASLSIIGKSLNHKSVQTTAIYSRLDTDPVRASVERATSAILAAAGIKQEVEVAQLKRAGEVVERRSRDVDAPRSS